MSKKSGGVARSYIDGFFVKSDEAAAEKAKLQPIWFWDRLLVRLGKVMAKQSLLDFRNTISKFIHKQSEWFSVASRSRSFGRIMLGLLAFVIAFICTLSFQQIPSNLREGMIAAKNIKADRNYEIVDIEASEKFRMEALASVPAIYDLDELVLDSILKRLHEAFTAAREKLNAIGKSDVLREDDKLGVEKLFSEKLGVNLTSAVWEAFWEDRFSEHAEGVIAKFLKEALDQPIVAERASFDAEEEHGVILRKLTLTSDDRAKRLSEEQALSDPTQVLSTEEVRRQIARKSISGSEFRSSKMPSAVIALAQLLIEPNCSLSRAETEQRREEAQANVKSVILKVNAGEMIIREGARYEPWHLKVLQGIQREKRRGMVSVELTGTLLIIALFLILPFSLVRRFFKRIKVERADLVLLSIVGLVALIVIRVSLLLVPAVHEATLPSVSSSALVFAMPVAGGAMLLRMFLGAEICFVFSVVFSALLGLFAQTDIGLVAYSLLSNFAAIWAISNADRRSTIVKAGFLSGIAGMFSATGIRLIAMASATESVTLVDLFWGAIFSLMSGMGSSVFAMILAPIVESITHYTSDIKLLELANLNHPLLRELIVRAPGTYHHSHMTGLLGEAAAEAIAAKSLLVRVGAYYHDIGKIKKPLYFIENAKVGENKHDRLTPHMSALIIAAHVKEGMEMAQRAGIPSSIIDMIPQHHGTRLISFFYEKAKELENVSKEKVDPKNFSYFGPKPQTREAAILMLADATEAAVRALKEKSTTRIQQTVQRVITDIFMEKQLDECELTLRDLNEIARAFTRILLGIYHSRIEYPKDAEYGKERPEISIVDESSTSIDIAD